MRNESRSQPKAAVPRVNGPRTGRLADAASLALVLAGYFALALWTTGGQLTLHYDTFRDLASVENILGGQPWRDPSVLGQTWWYAPGSPLVMAAVAKLTGLAGWQVYGSSMFWWGWLTPALLWWIARECWGRTAALLAPPMVVLGSLWWLTHATVGMPSVLGVSVNLGALLCWRRAVTGARGWAIATGVLLALSAWHHPLCAAVLGLSLALHAGLVAVRAPEAGGPRWRVAERAALAGAIAALLAAPLAMHLARLPRVNLAAAAYFAPELHDWRFALHAHAPLVLLLGLAGLVLVLRGPLDRLWLPAYALAALAGEIAGYLAHDLGWPIPSLIPHEFQWHEQLALGIAAAIAVARITAGGRESSESRRGWPSPRAALATATAAAALVPALWALPLATTGRIRINAGWREELALADWVKRHTALDDVFVSGAEPCYFLTGLTGRKVVTLPAAHMNPSVDPTLRLLDAERLMNPTDEAPFLALARQYRLSYVLMIAKSPAEARTLLAGIEGWPPLRAAYVTPESTYAVLRVVQSQAQP